MVEIIKILEEDHIKIGSQINDFPKDNKIYSYLKGLAEVKVLDLGCRVPQNLMVAYHEFNTSLLQGVDTSKSEEECLVEFGNHLCKSPDNNDKKIGEQIFKKCYSFFDYYKLIIKGVEDCLRSDFLSEADFNMKITSNIEFDTPLEKFLVENNQRYDLVICNNVLHFTEQSDNIISKIIPALEDGGILFIRVENRSDLAYDRVHFIQEINDCFGAGTIYEKYKGEEWHSLTFINLTE